MRYVKPLDIWAYGEAVMNGQIKLQSGQWVRLGENGPLSRFEYARPGYIRAYHGPNATKQYLSVRQDVKEYHAWMQQRRGARTAKAVTEA